MKSQNGTTKGKIATSPPQSAMPSIAAHNVGLIKPRYIGYLRVSKERDTTGSHTFETQEKRIRERLDRKHGVGQYDIEFLQDDGISGGYGLTPTGMESRVRPTLQIMAQKIQSGAYTGLIVYSLNRLMREVGGLAEMLNDVLLPAGASLVSATEEIDITTPDGRMMVYLQGIFHQKVREDIIKRNKDAAATRAEAGYVTGQVPYGWQWEPMGTTTAGKRRNVIPVEAEKHWVLHIKERYLSGWNSYRIAAELNDLQVPTPLERELWTSKAKKQRTRDGRSPHWSNSTVWNVLRSPLHAGLVPTPASGTIRGVHWKYRFWEPDISEQIIEQNRQRTSRFRTVTAQKNAPHLLAGLIYCARCGNLLYMSSTSETTKSFRSYKCLHGKNEGKFTCPDVVARAQWVEDTVVEELGRIAKVPEMRRLLEQEVSQAAQTQDETMVRERAQLQGKLQQLTAQFERWADGFSKGIMSEKQFAAICHKMERDEQNAKDRLATIEYDLENRQGRQLWLQQMRDKLLDFPMIWQHLDNDEKRQLLSLLLEDSKLTVDREGRDIKVRLKVHLLPEIKRTLIYRTYQGVNRSKAQGLQRLTQRQMVLLYHTAQGKSRTESAALMGCKVHSIYSVEKVIRKNLGGVSWAEAVEMAQERVEAYAPQLPFNSSGRAGFEANIDATNGAQNENKIFLSPLLMEVFVLFAQGATVPEVATQLNLSVTAVQGRRARILKTFGTSSMFEAVRKAKDNEIL